MKIFVLYNGRSIPWQIGDAQTVEQLKVIIHLDSTYIYLACNSGHVVPFLTTLQTQNTT